MAIDRKVFFDTVRQSVFGGSLRQEQVDGMNAIIDGWGNSDPQGKRDLRHLANMMAQTCHETGFDMWPIEEHGKGSGHPYGEKDPETGQTYYGRGYIQLTWRDNYHAMSARLGLTGDDNIEWHAEKALDPDISYDVMDVGMTEGIFRPPNKLANYFNDAENDIFNARDIINGDKNIIPSWSGGASIGKLIVGYHNGFLEALEEAVILIPKPIIEMVEIIINTPDGVGVSLVINGRALPPVS